MIDTAVDGRDGVEKALRLKPDVITLDVEMPVMNGIEALKEIVARTTIPVIMVSAVTEHGAKITMEALDIGAVDFIPKSKGADLHPREAACGCERQSRPPASRRCGRLRMPVPPPPSAPGAVRFAASPRSSSSAAARAVRRRFRPSSASCPPNLPVPIVVAQHMPPQFTLALAKRLDACCPPNVVEAQARRAAR